MRALPIEFRKRILQEEDKKSQDRLILCGVNCLQNPEIYDLIKNETGITPLAINRQGDKVIIRVGGISDKEQIFQALDREHLMGGGLISVRQESNMLTTVEIDGLMRRWLTVEDKARLRDNSMPNNPPQPKWQREVQAHPEEKNSAPIQEIKADTRAKTTQTSSSEAPKKAPEQNKGNSSKGGRGRGGGAPFSSSSHLVQPPTITPTSTTPTPIYMANPMHFQHPPQQCVFGHSEYPQLQPPTLTQWYPPTGRGYPINISPPIQSHPPHGWAINSSKGGKGGKGGKISSNPSKGKGGQ